ncbi:response regulator [Neosynechococcus sphagnicola]|uniref:response regulator n=1 Tax=Neosynechococcus sphagnicola TaxID=1501145 RepID=UPI00068CD59A|nr:response regulator [Neosynechococcus sphagnicola]
METAQKHRVLVIDDSLMARRLLFEQLSGDRFEVYEGKDGPTGLAVAEEVNPDLILLDFVMPGMNGYEVYQALRDQPKFVHTPVIVISSSYEEVSKKFGHPFVGFEFLHKQSTGEQLLERINAVLPEAVAVTPAATDPMTDLETLVLADSLAPAKEVLATVAPTETMVAAPPAVDPPPALPVVDLTPLIARIEQLEQQMVASLSHLQPLPDRTEAVLVRLSDLEQQRSDTESMQVLEQRFAALEQRLGEIPLDRSGEVLEKLTAMEQHLETLSPPIPSPVSLPLAPESLATLDAMIYKLDQFSPTATVDWQPILERLEQFEQQLGNLPPANLAVVPAATPPSLPGWQVVVVSAVIGAAIATLVSVAMRPSTPSTASHAQGFPTWDFITPRAVN